MQTLRISADRRSLSTADGKSFFYLADTAWELFHRLDLTEAKDYLRDRAAKGFTAIQSVALAELDGLHTPNRLGALPLEADDPTRPVEAYFAHLDAVIDFAADLGLYTALLPTWGDKWQSRWGAGPQVFTPANAETYGEWIALRYRTRPIIWVLGGDRNPTTDADTAIIHAMARGVRRGSGGQQLITYHPMGGASSGQFFHDADWLDFNMLQSGHSRTRENYRMIGEDYARAPVKPVIDAEPGYEDHPNNFKVEDGWLDARDVRRFAYHALLAGACGHTYGCHDIWQMLSEANPPVTFARTPWRQALALPGAAQMGHARRLLEALAPERRIPDQMLVVGDSGAAETYIAAARDSDGQYALVYIPDGRPVTVDATLLAGAQVHARWYDPRSGAEHEQGLVAAVAQRYTPPVAGEDWVLVLEVTDG